MIKRALLSLIILFNISAASRVYAAFEDVGAGARAPGMADAFVATADDANALYYNPAGLIQVGERQITAQYGQFVKGLSDGSNLGATYLAYAQPIRRAYWGTLGLGYLNFKADNLFTERTIFMSYGWRLRIEPFGWRGIPSMGVTLKQLHRQYQPDRFTENSLNDAGSASGQKDPLFANSGYSNDTYSADVGGLYQFGEGYRNSFGFTFMNVNQPDTSLGGDGDRAPLSIKMGLTHRPNWGLVSMEMRRVSRLKNVTDTDYALGLERNIPLAELGTMQMRGGYAQGSRGYKAMTVGASYIMSRVQLDYAFNFPIGALSDANGSHRLGLTVHMGMPDSRALNTDDMSQIDFIATFSHDSFASYTALRRYDINKPMTANERVMLLRMLMRQFPDDDPGMVEIKADLMGLIRNKEELLMDWPTVKANLLKHISKDDVSNADDALENFIKGNVMHAMARLALLRDSSRRDPMIRAITTMGLAEMAARTYRDKLIDSTIDQVRQIVEILPEDEVIGRAYRRLLNERIGGPQYMVAPKEELPEAPQTLVAPTPVKPGTTAIPVDEQAVAAKAFGTSLGYYLTRKANHASVDERESLLKQMKATYTPLGIDMSIVDRELLDLDAEKSKTAVPVVVPATKPADIPAKQVAPKPVVRPTPTASTSVKLTIPSSTPDIERGWQFYKQAIGRGITDSERIELLQSIIDKFGKNGADQVLKEIQKIKKRMQ